MILAQVALGVSIVTAIAAIITVNKSK